MGKPFKMKLRTKWSLSWRLEKCEHAKVDEAATRHKRQTGVVEQPRRGSNSQVFGVSERQQRQFTRGTHQKGNHVGSSQPRREQEERWMMSSGNRRSRNHTPPAPTSFHDLTLLPNGDGGEGNRSEFNSQKRRENAGGRPRPRSRSPRGEGIS